jgi:hypothetical protein
MKNIFLKSVAILLILLNAVTAVDAQTLSPGTEKSGGQVFCKRDFGNFLAIGIDFDGEGFWEYWKDILVRYNSNYCLYADIDSLLNRIDSLRKQLRQAFYVCDQNTTLRLTATYQQMSAELYYLRNFLNVTEGTSPDADAKVKKDLVTKKNNFRKAFVKKFSSTYDYYTAQTASTLFDRFESKYASKIEVYRNCQDSNVGLLKQKLKDLSNTFDTVKNLGKKFADRTARRAAQTQERVKKNPGLGSVFSANGVGDFVNRLVDVKVNGQDFNTFWEEVTTSETASTGTKVVQRTNIYYSDIAQDLTTMENRDIYKDMDTQFITAYDAKYRQISDSGLDDAITSLKELKAIIEGSYDPMVKIYECTSRIIGKQCGGK